MSETGEINQGGLIEKIRGSVQRVVNESLMPTLDYKSTVGIYGGKLTQEEGKLVWNNTGLTSRMDRSGDIRLRTYDEHTVKEPFKLLKRHPEWFYRFLAPGPKRHRGNVGEVLQNVTRLGLTDYYGPAPHGVEIKKPAVFQGGMVLQDIYRSDLIGSEALTDIDRFQALGEAVKYIRSVHENFGEVGEILMSDIIFQKKEGAQVLEPVLNLPDIIYNPDKQFGRLERKATDMLDFLFSVGVEELRRSGNWDDVKKALDYVVSVYGDEEVISDVSSLAKRGRLSMKGLAAQHNKTRLEAGLKIDEKYQDQLRQKVILACATICP